MDVRELYGASPLQQENLLAEESARISHATLTSGMMFSLPVTVTENSPDGHSATLQPTVKRAVNDPVTGKKTYEDHPIHPDVPVHFVGGGGVTMTHPIAKGDEGTILYMSRQIDAWRQSGGSQQPIDDAINDLGDAVHIPGVRSDPRKLQAVSTSTGQLRSDDGHHTIDHDPSAGTTVKSVDPSTAVASQSFNPFKQASKFISHAVQGMGGILGRAVDGGTEHSHGVDHGVGAFMKAMGGSGLHQVLAHPDLGSLLSSADGKHTVTASPSGVILQSASSIGLSAPSVSLPNGSVGASSLGSGAVSQSVGPLGGDLSGTLPSPVVTSLSGIDFSKLPAGANDAAAASAGVKIGGLYRNTAALAGVSVLAVRMA